MIIKEFPILYNQKANGLVQQYRIWVESVDDGTAEIISEYGQLSGILTQAKKYIKVGKNIGRSNETTPSQQAISEAESTFQGKLDNKYVLSVEHVGNNIGANSDVPDPMLAKSYDEYSHKIVFPCFVQPKLDGIRCIAKKSNGVINLWTRKGKPIKFMDHITSALEYKLVDGEMLDGELYSHTIDFQTITSIVRQQTERHEQIKDIQFHIYDIPVEGVKYKDRYAQLMDKFVGEHFKAIEIVETQIVNDEDDIDAFHQQMKRVGYEGTMVRSADGLYRFKYRSPDLLKYKDFISEEFLITGVREDFGPNGDECVFELVTAEDKPFNARSKGSSNYRRSLIEIRSTLSGKYATVSFQEKTNDGLPRFPVADAIRDYE